jgi:hypothetical protein
MTAEQLLGVAPWTIATFAATWVWQFYVHRDARRDRRDAKAAEVEQHRDDLTLKLIKTATDEAAQVRKEIEEVRQENKALRALEEHFYHFEQALNHLEAMLTATDADMRKVAEKNATAFLTRMRRLQQAKGNIQQEIQIVESANRIEGKDQA